MPVRGLKDILSLGFANQLLHQSVSGIRYNSDGQLHFFFNKESELRTSTYSHDETTTLNEWMKIEVSHLFKITVSPVSKRKNKEEYITTIRINGVIMKTIIDAEAAQLTNVRLSAAHRGSPANSEISNLKVTTFALGTAACTEEAEKTTCNCTNGYELVRDGNVYTCKSKR